MIVLFLFSVFLFPEKLSISGAMAMLLVFFPLLPCLLYERAMWTCSCFLYVCWLVLATSSLRLSCYGIDHVRPDHEIISLTGT